MPTSLTTFTAGDPIKAGELVDRFDTIEKFINEGITASDLQTSKTWVKTHHIFKPEFYGSPAPRCHAVTADTHWRHAQLDAAIRAYHHPDVASSVYINVPGLCASIKVPANDLEVDVMTSFYAWEFGGFNLDELCASFALFVDGTQQTGTTRLLLSSGFIFDIAERRQHNIVCPVVLSKGTHHVSVRCKALERTPNGNASPLYPYDYRHIFVDCRDLVVDVHVK